MLSNILRSLIFLRGFLSSFEATHSMQEALICREGDMKSRQTIHRARLVIIVEFVANNYFQDGVQNLLLHYEVDPTPYIGANFIHHEFHHPSSLLFPSSSCFLGHESPQILSNRLKRLKSPQFSSNTFARDYGCLALGPLLSVEFFSSGLFA